MSQSCFHGLGLLLTVCVGCFVKSYSWLVTDEESLMKSHFVLGRRVSACSCSGVELHTSTNTFTQTELCPTKTIKSTNVDENTFCVFYRTEVTGSKHNTKTKSLKWFQVYKNTDRICNNG